LKDTNTVKSVLADFNPYENN